MVSHSAAWLAYLKVCLTADEKVGNSDDARVVRKDELTVVKWVVLLVM